LQPCCGFPFAFLIWWIFTIEPIISGRRKDSPEDQYPSGGVDVVASDNKGNPVASLKSDDFTVLEDGRPQKISIFNFLQPSSIPVQAAPHLPANVFSNVPVARPTSLNVVLLDALNGEFAGRAYAREQLIKFLQEGGATQPMAVYALENHLKLLHDFTTDTRQAVNTIRDYKPHVINKIDTVYATASPFTQRGEPQSGPKNIETTLAALNFLAQALTAYPGRKNLIWLAEAFPATLFLIFFHPDLPMFCRAFIAPTRPEGEWCP